MTRVVIIGAGARGNRVFADLISRFETGFEIAGVVEPVDAKRSAFQREYGVPDERAFPSVSEFLEHERLADIVFVCTMDPTHYELCRAVSEAGYDVLIEKPVATTLPDCLTLLEVERRCRNRIFVAHVLRYAPFFQKLKQLVGSGDLGALRHLHIAEHIGHWHYAHSYVRGNWRREDLCAPIILTKCSHDLDILPWLVGQRVTTVSSQGRLVYFVPEQAPPEAADRCVDCGLQDACLYSAVRFYVNERHGWPFDVIAPPPDTVAGRMEAVRTGPYGRCVWRCDNDVCDNQTVTLEFESGMQATLGLHALTAENTRKVTALFDKAEVVGDLFQNHLTISWFTGDPVDLDVETVPLPGGADRHGGGDLGLLIALQQFLTEGRHAEIVSSLESSILSHVLAFLAEDSRRAGGTPLPVSEAFLPGGLM